MYKPRSKCKNCICLRVRVFEGPPADSIKHALRIHPVQKVECPLGLEEEDFVKLLRSRLPQLDGQTPFDIYKVNRKRKLVPVRIGKLTAEEVAIVTSHNFYLRPKTKEEELLQDKAAASDPSPADQPRHRLIIRPRKSFLFKHLMVDTDSHVSLQLRILEDPRIDVVGHKIYSKFPAYVVQCPCGLKENEFLDLLTSAFPHLRALSPFNLFISSNNRRLQLLDVESMTPENIKTQLRAAAKHIPIIYIRPRGQRGAPLRDSSDPVNLDSRSGSQQDIDYMEEEDNSDPYDLFSDDQDVEMTADDWQLDEYEDEPTSNGTIQASPMALRSNSVSVFCKVCMSLHSSMNMLVRHSRGHLDDPRRLCGVCGEQSESAAELKRHLQTHQRTHRCDICEQSFSSVAGLNEHLRQHRCKKCNRTFNRWSEFQSHSLVHGKKRRRDYEMEQEEGKSSQSGKDWHQCSICGKITGSVYTLSIHMKTHSNQSM
ncbi:zinc finger protein 813-like [Cheilinus undulatus]|uniref:zinc finger protein 813-like n=1 Tax=Cheilinus undulatus TaxID=241271 RepID=UPI001BD3F5EF|nr:zinc finger protein 813-like [Cheilinus undulatus]